MGYRVWGGRFEEETDRLVYEFNASIEFDQRLYRHDIEGSKAHVRMLQRQGMVSEEEAGLIIGELDRIQEEMRSGAIKPNLDYEDIHSFVEARLTERLGEVGKKLHTARSRNDQVALDLRLYLRDEIKEVLRLLRDLRKALVSKAEEYIDQVMPGYTHLQRAQPITVSQHLMAYYFMFERDKERFLENLKRTNVCPLGSGALAGSGLPIDREFVAGLLGMEAPLRNSLDGVSDRDFALEFLANSAIAMMHLSRLSEELVIWASQEFSFIRLKDAFCTGSSLMPQKKNPDVLELIRGKTGRVYGHLMGLLTTMKGLPLSYNKDMQEDKEAIFDTVDTLKGCLEIMILIVGDLDFERESVSNAVNKGYLVATDLVEYLVLKGVSFREAHELVGKMVLLAISQKKELKDMSLDLMRQLCDRIDEDVYEWLDPKGSIEKKRSLGGTSPVRVMEQIMYAKEELQEL